MSIPISGLGSVQPFSMPTALQQLSGKPAEGGEFSFQNLLLQTLQETASADQAAQTAISEGLRPDSDITNVEVFSAMKQADLSLRMMMQIRNKVMEAYTEIKRMQM